MVLRYLNVKILDVKSKAVDSNRPERTI